MRKLILIRHSTTEPTADMESRFWPLTDRGLLRSADLANHLRDFNIQTIFTSTQGKAIRTGELIAEKLGLAVEEPISAFDEHDRRGAPFFDNPADFQARVANFFTHPSELVHGNETAFDTRGRFTGGLYEVLDQTPNGTIAIVSHGTVLALFLAGCTGGDGFEMWQEIQRLGMPSFCVLSLPDLALESMAGVS